MRGPSRWERWDSEVRQGRNPAEVLASLPDETIIDLLRCADRQARDYERDLLLVEISNRVIRLRRQVATLRDLTDDVASRMEHRSTEGERIVEALAPGAPPETVEEARALTRDVREHAITLRRALREAERQAFEKARDR